MKYRPIVFAALGVSACLTPTSQSFAEDAAGTKSVSAEQAASAPRELKTESPLYPKVDSWPRLVKSSLPTFPTELRNRGVYGIVTVEFTVEPDGTVSNIRSRSRAPQELVEISKEAVASWRFIPAYSQGVPKAVIARQQFKFEP